MLSLEQSYNNIINYNNIIIIYTTPATHIIIIIVFIGNYNRCRIVED